MIVQQLVNGITTSGPLILVSMALGIMLGYMRVLNVAFGAFFTVAAVVTVEATRLTSSPVLVLAIAVAAGAALTLLIELVVLRPMRRQVKDIELGSFIATFGVSLALVAIVQRLTDSRVIVFDEGFPELDRIVTIAGVRVSLLSLVSFVAAVAIAVAAAAFLRRAATGKLLRALAADWEAGEIVGVRVGRVSLVVAIGCGALVGAAGFLGAVGSRNASFLAGEPFLLLAFVVAVVGGVGSVGGTAVAAIALSAMTTLVASQISSELAQAIVFAILFLTLVIRPEGLIAVGGARWAPSRLVRVASARGAAGRPAVEPVADDQVAEPPPVPQRSQVGD